MSKPQSWAWVVGTVAAAVLLVVAVQHVSGAYSSDFSSDPDEPAHVVSSLAVHDYLASGLRQNPLRFGEIFYLHYPKIAIGHWPPLFYVSEGLWMLAFGRTRGAMEALTGIYSALLLASVFWWAKREYGTAAGIVSSLALLMPRFMQLQIGQVAPNTLLALLTFWCAITYGRFLNHRRWPDAILSAGLALAAALVHGRAAVLLLVPFAVLAIGRFGWTRMRVVGCIAVVALVVWLPPFLRQAYPFQPLTALTLAAIYAERLVAGMGWGTIALALLGSVATIRCATPRHRLVMPALILSGWAFHALINARFMDQYLLAIVPGVAVMSGAGFRFAMDVCRTTKLRAAVVIVLCGMLLFTALPVARKPDLGYHLLETRPDRVTLISGDSVHEGAFVAEMALRDPGLNRFALRAGKILATSKWTGEDYEVRFSTLTEILTVLNDARVGMVLVQQSYSQPHSVELLRALRSGAWRETQPPGLPHGVLAFERASPLPAGDPSFSVDMRYSLGRMLTVEPH